MPDNVIAMCAMEGCVSPDTVTEVFDITRANGDQAFSAARLGNTCIGVCDVVGLSPVRESLGGAIIAGPDYDAPATAWMGMGYNALIQQGENRITIEPLASGVLYPKQNT